MSGETLTLSLPAPLAYELGAATQDFLADLLRAGCVMLRLSVRSSATRTVACRSARPRNRRVCRRPTWHASPTRVGWSRLSRPRHWPRNWLGPHDGRGLQRRAVDRAGQAEPA